LITSDPAQALQIGSDEGTAVGDYRGQNGFTGAIDEVRLYITAANADAVKDRYENNSELADDPRLVISFDDSTARDLSLHKNDGNLVNGKPVRGKFGKAMTFVRGANRGGKQAPLKSQIQPKWTSDVPIYVRGMVLANRTLYIVGPADIFDEEKTFARISQKDRSVEKILAKQNDILNGSEGSFLLSVNAESGEVEGEIQLDSLPAWDGLAAAQEKLFLSTLKGEVICFVGEE
jgi:hypothetical protein